MAFLSKNRIYLDHASATPVADEALYSMVEAEAIFGNPGAIHSEGVAAARSLLASRETIARVLACRPREVVFTSGLTEANNLGILGFAEALQRADRPLSETHWLVSAIEHDSVLECFVELERLGARITHIDPDKRGLLSVEKVAHALRKETVFASIGWANSEIGTVQPLSHIAHTIRAHEKAHGTTLLLHADAGQAVLYRAPSVHTLGVDLFSLGSGKLYGPRGVGALYIGKRAVLAGIMAGGGQERGLRPGTEPVALAAGFARAVQLAESRREKESKRLEKLRDAFAARLLLEIPGALLNGDLKRSLPHMLNISIPQINSEYLVLALDQAGIALSTKAACSEGNRNESHVVKALGGEEWRSKNTLRFSLGISTTESELSRALKIFLRVLRSLPS
jgi:cysteine desulfurase